MNKNLNQFVQLLNKELGAFLSISFGVFLFVLFFQPFPLESIEFNNRLIFIAGLGGIVFLFMVLARAGLDWLSHKYSQNGDDSVLPPYVVTFFIFALSSVSFAFYLRYVGAVNISFYIMLKVVLICLAPPVVLRLYDLVTDLRSQNESLVAEKKSILQQMEKLEENYLSKSIEFTSESNSESLKLVIADVVFIRSADNYVEIVFKEGESFKKKLIRNTLKNIEQQIRPYSNFLRCHRICIVNTHYIEKLNGNYNSHWLTIKEYPELIPVSRQYLLKLKETM
ncbi:MAG TPA: LytTR family DNA-binding domain-containing protein [Bacteroidales bacterium]